MYIYIKLAEYVITIRKSHHVEKKQNQYRVIKNDFIY